MRILLLNYEHLLNQIKAWFEKNKDIVTIDISIDGTNSMQQSNRGCNIHKLPIEWIHQHWPENRFKMTISPQTLPNLAQGIIYLENLGYPTIPTLAIEVEWKQEDVQIYNQQLINISNYYLNDTNKRPPSFLLRPIDSLFNKAIQIYKSCETGDSAITYDSDEKTYPCIIFSPIVLSSQYESWTNIDFSNQNLFKDEDCEKCIIKNMCKTCYGLNYKYRGNIQKRDKLLCPMYKTEIKNICYFQKHFILNKKKQHSLSAKEMERYEQACIIYKNLSTEIAKL